MLGDFFVLHFGFLWSVILTLPVEGIFSNSSMVQSFRMHADTRRSYIFSKISKITHRTHNASDTQTQVVDIVDYLT